MRPSTSPQLRVPRRCVPRRCRSRAQPAELTRTLALLRPATAASCPCRFAPRWPGRCRPRSGIPGDQGGACAAALQVDRLGGGLTPHSARVRPSQTSSRDKGASGASGSTGVESLAVVARVAASDRPEAPPPAALVAPTAASRPAHPLSRYEPAAGASPSGGLRLSSPEEGGGRGLRGVWPLLESSGTLARPGLTRLRRPSASPKRFMHSSKCPCYWQYAKSGCFMRGCRYSHAEGEAPSPSTLPPQHGQLWLSARAAIPTARLTLCSPLIGAESLTPAQIVALEFVFRNNVRLPASRPSRLAPTESC